jgi:hypothetical protein
MIHDRHGVIAPEDPGIDSRVGSKYYIFARLAQWLKQREVLRSFEHPVFCILSKDVHDIIL